MSQEKFLAPKLSTYYHSWLAKPISFKFSNAYAVGSDIKSSHKMSENTMLMNELKQVNLDVLYDKFHLAAVTSDIVWELNDDILQEIGLTKLEQLKYRKAKEKFKE